MMALLNILSLLMQLATQSFTSTEEVEYRAVVTEYKPYGDVHDLPGTLLTNTRRVEELAALAAHQKADIIVLPEYAMFDHTIVNSRKTLKQLLQEVLPPGYSLPWNPCNSKLEGDDHKYLQKLSCSARDSGIYVVVNVGEIEYCNVEADPTCPSDGGYFYNTNVAFDRSGNLIARYRKSNLYYEYLFNYPEKELVYFDTDFGVRFGLIICFDIMWEHPYRDLIQHGVRDIIFSSAWLDQMPYFLTHQVLSGNARMFDVNLLASNYYAPRAAGLGSGIFQGYKGPHDYHYSTDSESSTMLKVVKTRRSVGHRRTDCRPQSPEKTSKPLAKASKHVDKFTTGVSDSHVVKNLDMTAYNSVKLDSSSNFARVQQKSTFCEVSYHMTNVYFPGVYKLVVTEDFYLIGSSYHWFNQVCAVVYCLQDDPSLDSCSERNSSHVQTNTISHLKLTGKFDVPDNVHPSALHTNLSLFLDWTLTVHHHLQQVTLEFSEPGANIQAVALYGRNFMKDS